MKIMMPIVTSEKEQPSAPSVAASAAAPPPLPLPMSAMVAKPANPALAKAEIMKAKMAAAAERSRQFNEMRMVAKAMAADVGTPAPHQQRSAPVPAQARPQPQPQPQPSAFQPARFEKPQAVRPNPGEEEGAWPPRNMKREEISTGRYLVSPELIGNFWTNELYNEGLVGFTAEKHYYCALPQDYADRLYAEFPQRRREFVVKLAEEDRDMLEQIGMTPRDINMARDGVLPENYTVMLKVPYVCGGTNDFDNMLLIHTRPLARRAESILVRQIAYQLPPENVSRAVYVPMYKGRIYLPSNPQFGGGGQSMAAAMKQGNAR